MTRSEMRADRIRWRRGDALVAVGAVLLGLVLAGIFFSIRDLQHELYVANGARDALARQVQGLGATPVAGKPGSRGGMGPVGPSGAPGPTGPSGRPGPTGPSGKTGATGSAGSDGVNGVSVTGSPGQDGSDGTSGTDGAAGPAGPAGPQGDPGPAGPQGEPGPAGPQGPAGAAGSESSCPDGYSMQTPSWDPDALVCRRDSTPDPSPTDGSSILGLLALDPLRRKYL